MKKVDLFADALWQFYRAGNAVLYTERDDGFRRREDVSWYFTSYSEFPVFEKQALRFARGRVLDVGCGAGRHSLYLQKRGLHVTAVDVSPRIVELARARGVKDVRLTNICRKLPFREGDFDTAILFGNNLGIAGTRPRFRRMLRELHRVTTPQACILATTRMPGATNARDLSYLRHNLQQKRALGQMRLRLWLGQQPGAWFDLLLFAPTDLLQLAAQEGWDLKHVMPQDLEEGYAVVLEKK